jgi:hypothetical protein
MMTIGSNVSGASVATYQFSQLEPYFEKDLFGIEFDFDHNAPEDQSLHLMADLLNQSILSNVTSYNNVIALVGYESKGIKSAIIASKRLNRTQDLIVEEISWQTILPFTKILHYFTLPTGEEVIIGQDILGMALKANGSGFDSRNYQLGYTNVPIDFLELLMPDNQNFSFDFSVESSVMLHESNKEFQIDLTYSNLIFLFQTSSIDLNTLFGLKIADHLIIAQIDEIRFSIILRKYLFQGTSGLETLLRISIGDVKNLVIKEELPQNQNWTNAMDYEIQENFKDLIPIHETFSWYQGPDILQRLHQFSEISFSLITSQNIGLLNKSQALDDGHVVIDGQKKTTVELAKDDFPATEEISFVYDEYTLVSDQINGRNFAIEKQEEPVELQLKPIKIRSISLNQQNGFAGNRLFLQETSLLKEVVAECIRQFVADSKVSTLKTNEIITQTMLDLTLARYFQDFQVVEWSGSHFTIELLQVASGSSLSTFSNDNLSQITFTPLESGIIGLITLSMALKQRKNRILLPKRTSN